MLELSGSCYAKVWVSQQTHQRFNVVPAMHVAQQCDSRLFIDHRAASFVAHEGRQKTCLDVGGFVHTGRYAGAD